MRTISVIARILCVCAAALSSRTGAIAADAFPYTAYASSDDVYVRSGPGKNYYPTDKLGKGEAVEIYRHDPGGWYAIRPPQGSFCWVPADSLKPTGEGLAVVQKNRTLAFVGTKFSGARDVHQVQLDAGEEVEILDIKQLGEGADAKAWAQIAPPAGEFRWVFGKYIARDLPPGVSRPDSVAAVMTPKSTKPEESFGDRTAKRSGWTGSGREEISAADTAVETPRAATTEKNVARDAPAAVDPFQAELDAIDMKLSQMVAEDAAAWDFTALRRKSEASLTRAQTALERGRVRLVLNRIARFEDIKRRHDLFSQPGGMEAIAAARPPLLPVDERERFDGVGKLTPVVSQRVGAPRFALVDASNQVVSFISPTPGMNLQPYVGKQVGVSGQRGFMPELKKPHVTAQRVNVIEGSTTLR